MNDASDLLLGILSDIPESVSSKCKAPDRNAVLAPATNDQAKSIIAAFRKKMPVKIHEGGRHQTMCRYGAVLRAVGYGANDIRKMLVEHDNKYNDPPKNDSGEIDEIVVWAMGLKPGIFIKQSETERPVTVDNTDAIEFLKDKPIEKIRDQYNRVHIGDEDALRQVIWAFCVKWLKYASDEGTHLLGLGDPGTGKTHGITTAMGFLPPELTMVKGISPRYLFYTSNLRKGMMIYLDELPSDPDLIDMLKAIISAYPNGGSRGTVRNGEPIEQSIPPRITINTSAVELKVDEQFTNRMTVIRPANNKEDKKAKIDFRISLYEGKKERIDDNEMSRIHNAFRHISNLQFNIIIPEGALSCDNCESIDLRCLNQFYDAIMGNAIFNYPNRNPVINGNEITITVNKQDFDEVIYLYQDPNEYMLKLPDTAVIVKNYLEKVFPEYKTIGEIADATKISKQTARNAILGRTDRKVDCLINSGYVEEISLMEEQREARYSSMNNETYSLPSGIRTSTKVYKATGPASGSKQCGKKKRHGHSQIDLSDIVGMMRWNDEKASNPSGIANQANHDKPSIGLF